MDPPRNLRDLVTYLAIHPYVRITGPTPDSREPTTRDDRYLCWVDGRLWFQPEDGSPPNHIPIDCRMKAAASSETGLIFDGQGFTVTKFGVAIRVEYLS
jgi:hypothetical protein